MRFIGVSFGVIDHRLVCIATSERYSVIDPKGLSSKDALAFLASIVNVRARIIKQQGKGEPRPVLVMYDTSIELELLMRDLTPRQKDVLFGLYRAAEDKTKDTPLFDPTTPEYRGVVETRGFKVSTLPGKILRVARARRAGLQFYDIASYFDSKPISEASAEYLKDDGEVVRIDKNILPLWETGLAEAIADRCEDEARLIVRLAEKVHKILEPLGINLRHYYGPSAVASRCLHKWEARKQAKRLNEKNSPYELIRAIDCAYFGGRPELIKNGRVRDVRTFDLNSAYGYATTLLSQFHTPLRFTRKYRPDAPFSCWLVKYELPDDVTLGVLPTRLTGGISYRRGGTGYYWWPEVDYLLRHYPDNVQVRWGYVGPEYQPVTFAQAIHDMYAYRQELKGQGDAGEGIIRLALSNLYGKFAQNTGSAHFQCRAWAGWITSLIRRMLLDAVTGFEDRVIAFCQDAVHLQGVNANVKVGDGLGEWKEKRFASGIYVSPGIYDLYTEDEHKIATRGSNVALDFERIAKDLSEKQVAELTRTFFVGWQLSRQVSKFNLSYLSDVEESLNLIPTRLRARNYLAQFDWFNEYRNSKINARVIGQSARYIPNETGRIAALGLKLKDRGWA